MTDSPLPPEVREAVADPKRAFGKYRLVSLLGKGGMGEVWKAWDTALGRWTALKLLPAGSSDEDIERFRREALAAARLSHPNIASLYDAGEVDGRRFIAMQFIDGRTLSGQALPLRRALEVVRDAALGVHFAHEQGLIHRDLKPSNIMIDSSGRVAVIDFGLARSAHSTGTLSKSGSIVGTPPFMSPEQAAGSGKLDARADIYGLGATLYSLATGRAPFVDESQSRTLVRVLSQEPVPPREVRSEIPRDVETIILKAMEKEPKRRYATAALLAEDLERHLEGRPILARRPGLLRKLGRALARHRAIAGAALAGLGAVAVTLALLVPRWRAEREKAERETREKAGIESELRELQELNRLWAQAITAKEWTRQSFREPADIRAEFEKAEKDLTAFVAAHPRLPQAFYVRARVRICLRRLGEAEEDLKRATDLDPHFSRGWALLGQLFLECHSEAVLMMRRPVSGSGTAPSDDYLRRAEAALARVNSGEAVNTGTWGFSPTRDDEVTAILLDAMKEAYVTRKPGEAVERLRRAHAVSPSEEYCWWLGIWNSDDERMKWLDEAVTIAPNWSQARLARGSERVARGDFKGAVEDLTIALQFNPRHAAALNNRGNALRSSGRVDEAVADYTTALEIAGEIPDYLANRACARTDKGDLEGAMRDFDRAIELDVRYAEAYAARGGCHLKRRDLERAIRDFATAAELVPGYRDAHVLLGETYYQLRRFPEAIAEFTRSIEISPSYDVFNNRGLARRDTRDLAGALKDFDKAAESNPDSADVHFNRGTTLGMMGRDKDAIADLDRAIELDPRNPRAYFNRGISRARMRRREGALQDFSRAVELAPKYADAWFSRGLTHAEMKNGADAAADLRKALEVAPPDWPRRADAARLLDSLSE